MSGYKFNEKKKTREQVLEEDFFDQMIENSGMGAKGINRKH